MAQWAWLAPATQRPETTEAQKCVLASPGEPGLARIQAILYIYPSSGMNFISIAMTAILIKSAGPCGEPGDDRHDCRSRATACRPPCSTPGHLQHFGLVHQVGELVPGNHHLAVIAGDDRASGPGPGRRPDPYPAVGLLEPGARRTWS
jgi:hypothetical protein